MFSKNSTYGNKRVGIRVRGSRSFPILREHSRKKCSLILGGMRSLLANMYGIQIYALLYARGCERNPPLRLSLLLQTPDLADEQPHTEYHLRLGCGLKGHRTKNVD